MKKLIAMVALAAISFTVAAQTAPTTPSATTKQVAARPVPDMMIFRGGKVMIFKDSHLSPMDKPMTTKNGTVITPAGLMTMKDGTTKQMVEGDRLDLNGNPMMNKPAPHQTTQPAQQK
jgi:hypothetical protein